MPMAVAASLFAYKPMAPVYDNGTRTCFCALGARPWFPNASEGLQLQCEPYLTERRGNACARSGRSLSAPRQSESGWNTPMNSPRPAPSPVPSLQLPMGQEVHWQRGRCSTSLSPTASARVYCGHGLIPEGPAIPPQRTSSLNPSLSRFPFNALSSMARDANAGIGDPAPASMKFLSREPLMKSAGELREPTRVKEHKMAERQLRQGNHPVTENQGHHVLDPSSDYVIYAQKVPKKDAGAGFQAGDMGTADASPKNSVWKRYFAQGEAMLEEVLPHSHAPGSALDSLPITAPSSARHEHAFENSKEETEKEKTAPARAIPESESSEGIKRQDLTNVPGGLRTAVERFGMPSPAHGENFCAAKTASQTDSQEGSEVFTAGCPPSTLIRTERSSNSSGTTEFKHQSQSELKELNTSISIQGRASVDGAFVPDPDQVKAIEVSAANVSAAAQSISLKLLHELRSFRQPPAVIRQVVEAALSLFGVKAAWSTGRRHLDSHFLQKLKSFTPLEAAKCPSAQVHQFFENLDAPAFSDQSLLNKCRGAAPLAQWCFAAAALLLHLKVSDTSNKLSNRTGIFQVHKALGLDQAQRHKANKASKTSIVPDLGGLFVKPAVWELSIDELQHVEDLVIGREGVGQVTFPGQTDCRGLIESLSQILSILPGEIVLYPDATLKPPIGEGLNKAASVVLFGCMPKCQARLLDAKAQQRYKQRVAQMTEEKGAIFEDYDPNDGTWKFRVPHF
ncbi:Nuclear pore complex protein NUP98B (Nucleoporin 98B) (Nucleoporin autopeptidase) [Durusdinium trenchii]